MKLRVLGSEFAILRLAADAAIPDWVLAPGALVSITRTQAELSILCRDGLAAGQAKALRHLRAIKVDQPLDFAMTGVLASLAAPLAEARVPIFALSTFDTDYVMVGADRPDDALAALRKAGHTFPA